jgi:3D (Asp-Asp-Asp) domain-containing protein
MVKPQGVWLRPTVLGEVAEAAVAVEKPRIKAVQPAAKQPAAVARSAARPLLSAALVLCCCVLAVFVALQVHAVALPALLPDSNTAESARAEDAAFSLAAVGPHVLPEDSQSAQQATSPEPEETGEPEHDAMAAQPEEAILPNAAPSRAFAEPPQIASRGDAESGEITVGDETFKYTRRLPMECTAYTWTGDRTATGTWPAIGTIAVDPLVIDLGSRVYVEGYGLAIATDTGGLIKGHIIDVYLNSEAECVIWGRKRGVMVYILE